MSAMTSVVWRHAVGEGMLSGEHPQDEVKEVTKKLTPSLGFYAAAIAIGLLAPRLAVFLYLAIALYLLIPFPWSCSDAAGGPARLSNTEHGFASGRVRDVPAT